jgi:hypothetical protein
VLGRCWAAHRWTGPRVPALAGRDAPAAEASRGNLYLDALVHEFMLPPTSAENQLHNERWHVERPTGLIDLVVTEPGHYLKLLHQIREHRFFRGWGGGRPSRGVIHPDRSGVPYGLAPGRHRALG